MKLEVSIVRQARSIVGSSSRIRLDSMRIDALDRASGGAVHAQADGQMMEARALRASLSMNGPAVCDWVSYAEVDLIAFTQ